MFFCIDGKEPRRYGLDAGFWPCAVAAGLIAWKFAIRLGLTAVGGAASGEVFFWHEAGCRADAVPGGTRGGTGHRPVVERPSQRQSISAALLVTASAMFWYCTYRGGLTAALFVTLPRQMMRDRKTPMHPVVDGLPAHQTALMEAYVASTSRHG